MILWGEEEQRNERAFHACVETSDMELVTTRKEDGPMKQGALIFDEQTDRYDIRFDLADYYGGLHCGETFDVMVGGRWRPTRIEMAENFVNVGSNHIGVFALQHFIGKLPPDLMGLLRRGFPRFKGLYQVVGQIVALLVRLI